MLITIRPRKERTPGLVCSTEAAHDSGLVTNIGNNSYQQLLLTYSLLAIKWYVLKEYDTLVVVVM